MAAEDNLSPQFDDAHSMSIAYNSDRVKGYNSKSGGNTKTVGWRTRCSCGHVVETKSNSIKAHEAKVQKHLGNN